ncbi:pilus assembly protein PilY [Moraxella sp. PS-22]|uniref:Pilus assembly protein PilY n=1 Tax=Moraxella tetraodonis TaxID=2767221 RepID=A0A9X2A5L0_9GAMM|nr:pilus assembly protein PilY [Moraxella tetraodonis]MCG8148069.1 pilus assembly protein PilY [Moraxella tetraodonis]
MKFTPHCSSYQQKLLPRMRYLVAAVVSLMIMPPSQSNAAQNNIGDLEIYKAAEGGKVTITMMLDTSGSMTQTQAGSNACDLNGVANTTTNYSSTYDTSATTPSYRRYYCIGRDNRKYYDRLTRLKDAIFALMDSTALDSNKVAIGIGQFSSQSDSNNTTKTADGTSGKIVVPAKLLDNAQRLEIKTAVANMFGGNGTPAANAYAEVGAYMLGETTDDGINRYENYYVRNSNGNYQYCINWSGTSCVTWSSYYSGSNFRASDWSTLSSRDYYGNYYSGYRLDRGFNKSISTSKTNNKYQSPLSSTTSQCDGQGIYFLTDGEPNSSYNPRTLMRAALGSSGAAFNVPTAGNGTLPNGSQDGHGMPEVGAFAQALRTTTSNPKGLNIKTAVVGFGSDFDLSKYTNIQRILNVPVLSQNTALPVSPAIYQDKQDTYFNCSLITDPDAKNACNWGAKSHPLLPGVGGYGEGGFYSAQSTDDVINSIVKFVSDLNQEIPAAPSGTITIPDDPYRVDSQLAVAYYPMVEAKVSEAKVIWPGNVKKYNLNAGTLNGKSNQPLFTGVSGDLNPSTQDLWSDRDYPNANNAVTSGGFYAQLKTPNTGISSVRTLYIEDLTSTGATTTKLRKFAVNTNGKLTLDGNPITDSNTFNDTSTYTTNTVTKLLNFLGFNNISVATTGTDVAKLSGITLTPANATTPIKVVGATIHSAPNAVSYSATLDDDGRVTDSRDDYVLFGSMDGAVHLVNSDNYGSGSGGQEKFAVILRKMMSSQPDALVKDATQTAIGAPKAGVDAPWLVTADYKYDFPSKRVNIDTSGSGTTQKGVFAYGGLRMGGEGFYGLNLSNYDSPTMLFSIDASTSGFDRMGQIWSKPTKAKIKTSATDTGTDVLIFGGGYDTCYEDENYQVGTITSTLTNQRGSSCNRTTNREALGNAVYIINAKTGALIWSATKTANSKGTSNTTNNNLNNSIVGGITVLDRNNDGYMDGIYFADLGGQVFRADFTNAGDNTYNKSTTDNKYTPAVQTSFSNQRVTRILQPRYAIANTLGAITTNADAKYNLRFYERPVVSFFRDDNSKLFAMVNVISGDRSSPLSKIRPIDKADRLYGIIDNDVTKANSIFFANDFTTTNANKQTVVDLADTDLVNVPTALGTMPTAGYSLETKNGVINTLKNNSKKGWYYPLTRFDGYANVLYNKGVGKSEVINSMLYTTVYNPDMSYGEANPCSAQIVGGSERELYCLPYGVCMDDTSTTGTGGFLQAGQGIQELTLGPYSSSKTNIRLLIGNTSLTQRSTLDSRFSYGIDNRKDTSLLKTRQVAGGNTSITQIGGDGSAAEYLYRERYTLYPKTWYEVFN